MNTEPKQERKSNSLPNLLGCLGVIAMLGCGLAWGVNYVRERARLSHERSMKEFRESTFQAVKQGRSAAYIMDSKLLPMLAEDADCRSIVTRLDFFSMTIDPSDAVFVRELSNVTSMTFYCTRGTEELLIAAEKLPITELYFELTDLSDESFMILKRFPQLKQVRIEHVVKDSWIDSLRSELPNVNFEAPNQ